MTRYKSLKSQTGFEIAIIGMGCRFPDAENPDEFWRNLIAEKESITFFNKDEIAENVPAEFMVNDKNYIPACGYLDKPDFFDGSFFEFSNKESLLLDPQIRLFLECSWAALEESGYAGKVDKYRAGVFGTASDNLLWQMVTSSSVSNLLSEYYLASILNNKDFLSTIASYKLNLTGTSFNLSTACSSSLVAVHLACQSLLSGNIDLALAGGGCIKFPFKQGYVHQDGMILSKDGHCRSFDLDASGTVGGNGGGVVLLKRLDQALEDKDHIYAVIKGSAVNNDGIRKIGFTAPSIDGQAEVIMDAHYMAEINPESIGYVEAHGSGTQIGDQIEIEALNKAFNSTKKNYCAIGSVKTNIGHLDTAAGIAGLIKATLSLKNKKLIRSLNYKKPNQGINFAESPFYVNETTRDFSPVDNNPLRAGVSSFGISGTNAHVVLEESPEEITRHTRTEEDDYQLVLLSAKKEISLKGIATRYKQYFEENDISFSDAAHTTRVGRKHFNLRRCVVGRTKTDAIEQLDAKDFISGCHEIKYPEKSKKIYLLFTSEGRIASKEAQAHINFATLLTEYTGAACELITLENWETTERNIKHEQDIVSVVIEIGDSSGYKTVFADLTKHNDCIEYIYFAKELNETNDSSFILNTIGLLWEHGMEIKWDKVYAYKDYYVIPLPTYVFDKTQFTLKLDRLNLLGENSLNFPLEDKDLMLFERTWQNMTLNSATEAIPSDAMVLFADDSKLKESLLKAMGNWDRVIIEVAKGDHFHKVSDSKYIIRDNNFEDYVQLLDLLEKENRNVVTYVDLFSMTEEQSLGLDSYQPTSISNNHYYNLLHLARALGYIEATNKNEKNLYIISNNLHLVGGNEQVMVDKAILMGPIRSIPVEFPLVNLKSIDFDLLSGKINYELIARQIVEEINRPEESRLIAYRGKKRYVEDFKQIEMQMNLPEYSDKSSGWNIVFCGNEIKNDNDLLPLHSFVSGGEPRKFTFVFRKPLDDDKALDGLKEKGVEVEIITCDFYNKNELEFLLAKLHCNSIDGIFCLGLVKEEEYSRFILEAREHIREKEYMREKWSFVLNLFNGTKDLDYKFVMFYLPGSLYTGKESNSLGSSLVHAINGLCAHAERNNLKKWYTYFSYPETDREVQYHKIPTLTFAGSSTEIIVSKRHPRDIMNTNRKTYDEIFNVFLKRKRPMKEVFYKPSWIGRKNINIDSELKEKSGLLFVSNCHYGQMLEKAFSTRFKNLVIVREGEAFFRYDKKTYSINSSEVASYYDLFDSLQAETGLPDIIIHGFNFNASSIFAPQNLDEDLNRGLYSLINIARAMGRFETVSQATICSLTNNVSKVAETDIINPGKAPVLAAVKIVPFEYPSLSCLNLDIDAENEDELMEIVDSILVDIKLASEYYTLYSYRKGQRFIERFEQYYPVPETKREIQLKEKGIYLITGGFGGMGFSIATFLAKNYRAKCVLVGRSPFPPSDEWNDYAGENEKTAEFIKKMLELEALGAEFLVVQTDISDKEQVSALADKIEQRWGAPLNGIIHTAGLIDYNGIIQNRSREKTAEIAAPKIDGTINLDQKFNEHKLDFFVLCSAIGNIIPASKVGEIGYSAGNEFLDAYTHYKCDRGDKVITINWNDWTEVGMSVNSHNKRYEGKDFVPEFDESIASKPEEGVEAFYHILHMNQRRLVIAPYDLSSLILKDVEMNYVRMTKDYLNPIEVGNNKADKNETELLSKTEAKMLDIYRDLFQSDDIGIEDNFFDIDGDSLMAMSILSYIHAHFDVRLPVDKFFNQPTIREVAKTIDSLNKKKFTTITKAEPKELYVLSPAQERMFVTDQIYKDMALTTYNEPYIIKLKGKVEISRAEWALNKILERHESFRTSYHFINKIPVQKVHNNIAFKIEVLEGNQSSIESVIRAFIKPFDLSTPPLIRAGLLQVDDNEWILIIDKHHITCDGTSNQIFLQDFVDLYCGEVLSEQVLQYVDFSEWYNHTYRESMQNENERFWLNLFKDGVPELKLPYDHKKTSAAMFQGALLDFELTSEQSEKWRNVFAGKDTTQFVSILAVYSLFLSRITGQKDFTIGSPVSGRWHKDMQSIVGMFVNMLSFRIRFGDEGTFVDFLKAQKDHYLQVFENQYYPFDLLVKKVVKKRDLLDNPIFNVSLEQHTFHDSSSDSENIGNDFTFEHYQLPSDFITSRFDLSLLFGEKGDRLAFRFIYAKALFDESTIQEYRKSFTAMLEKILDNPDIQLEALLAPDIPHLPVIKKQESRQVVSYADASSHQERLWFIDSFEANKLYVGSPVYHNIPALVSLDFVPDTVVLQKAVNNVFNKYDALCTTVLTSSYKPVQVISKPANFPVQVREEEFDENNQEGLLALVNREAQIPFVLKESPLVRIILFRNSNNRSLLVIVAHHLISDNYSLKLLLQELIATTQTGDAVKLDEGKLQYSDYSDWQASIPDGAKKQLLTFWKSTLIDKVKPLELYTDFPREEVHVYKAGFKTFALPKGILEKANNLTSLKNIETATVLMAAFKALLYRYSGAENITIGQMTDNRKKGNGDSIIGPLAGLLPISIDITPGMTFEELLMNLSDYLKKCEPYMDIPFESIVSYINPVKDMSRTALFDILFRYSDISGDVNTCKFLDTNLGLGKYDLNLLIEKTGSSFDGTLVYNALYYASSTIDHMVEHFSVLLDELLTNPQKDLLSYPIITGKAKETMLELQLNNSSFYPRELTLFEAFTKQVEKTPDKTAINFNGRIVSYRELEKQSINLSNHLLETYAIQPGEIVALLLNNSEWMIVTILAILRTGGCYLPINIENPEDRIKYYMEDSNSKLLITDQGTFEDNLQEPQFEIFDLSRYVENPRVVQHHPAASQKQTDPAYIIYTSGTTGKPKGCVVTHRNVIRLILNEDLPFSFTDADKWIMAHAYSFDFSIWEIFGSLFTGGELVIPSLEEVRDVERFVNIVKKNRITVLNQTPGAFSAFMQVEKPCEPELQQHLRYVLFGGAKLEPYLLKDWIVRYPLNRIAVCNLYGITETTVHATYHFLVEDEITSDQAASNIGGPIPETEIYILNDKLELVPRGVIGEIYVGGSGLSAGYLNRPELNKLAFIASPFNAEERLYKSGDLGRWTSAQDIQYLGRKDRQVKIRGYRIELGEIESRLNNYSGINQVHVVQHPETEKLCAYIVANKDIEVAWIRNYLSEHLPIYMIPSHFIKIDKIPLTKNGKVDVHALPLSEEYYVSDEEFVLPGNETEEKITEIIKDLLKINKISVLDNYFDMGIDSLMLIQMNSRIQDELGIKLSLMELFKHTTISQLANFITYQDSSYSFNEDKAKRIAESVSNLDMIKKKLKEKLQEI